MCVGELFRIFLGDYMSSATGVAFVYTILSNQSQSGVRIRVKLNILSEHFGGVHVHAHGTQVFLVTKSFFVTCHGKASETVYYWVRDNALSMAKFMRTLKHPENICQEFQQALVQLSQSFRGKPTA